MKKSIKTKFVNFIGGIGYVFTALLWVFTVVIYANPIKQFVTYITPEPEKTVAVPHQAADISSNLPIMIFGAIVTIAILALSIYVFIKTPKVVVKSAETVVRESAKTITPVVMRMQHTKVTPVSKKRIYFYVAEFMKLVLLIIPMSFCIYSQSLSETPLNYNETLAVSLVLVGLASAAFLIQYITARLMSVHRQDIK